MLKPKWPPGLLGEIAEYIYAQAPKPVYEIAIAGAIGLVAGICGRAFNVSGTGLNQYVLVIAETGRGKEAMGQGIDALASAVEPVAPDITKYLGPSVQTASGLMATVQERPSIVCQLGEFGLLMSKMATTHEPKLQSLKRFMLDLYGKSGEGQVWRPQHNGRFTEWRDRSLRSPALTILAETAPSSFWDRFSDRLILDGFMPRFLTLVYEGQRPPSNPEAWKARPSETVIEGLATLVNVASNVAGAGQRTHVEPDKGAAAYLAELDAKYDAIINGMEGQAGIQMWNRVHLKILKLSALIAVGVDPFKPVIRRNHVEFARQLVERDLDLLLSRVLEYQPPKQRKRGPAGSLAASGKPSSQDASRSPQDASVGASGNVPGASASAPPAG